MNKNLPAALVAVVCLVGFAVDAAAQGGGQNNRKDHPKLHWKDLDFDAGETPLQNAIRNARGKLLDGKKGQMSGDKLKQCQDALDANDPKRIAKFCEVPDLETEQLASGPIGAGNGKSRGKRNVTQTTLIYDEPKQHGKPGEPEQTEWDPLAIRGKKWGGGDHPGIANQHGPNGGKGRSGQLSRGQAVLPESRMNDDHDCLDRVTGAHLRDGLCYQTDPGGALLEDANGNHTLLATLLYGGEAQCPTSDDGPVPCCRHAGSGTLLLADPDDGAPDDCWDEADEPIGTTLQELIDEDGYEDVDNDGDGAFDEDVADGQNNDDDCVHYSDFVEADDQPTAPGQEKKYRREVQHATGPQCSAAGWKALVDEDGQEDPIDDDADELFDEDPEEPASVPGIDPDDAADYARCEKLYQKVGMTFTPADDWTVDPTSGEAQCNLTRAMVKLANDKCAADDNPVEQDRCSKRVPGGKLFKADEHGRPDPDGDGYFETGKERREVKLIETFGVKCKHGQTYDEESGMCVAPLGASGTTLRLGPALGMDASPADDTVARQAMMGFTFGPPVLEWGWRVKVDICIDLGFWEFCFEIFYARVGYEFDLAAGLRLPVQVEVEGLPADILASMQDEIDTSLTPLDFDAAQYTAFCEHHDLDSAWYIANCTDRFAFPDALNEADGDELVAYYEVFAGIVVRVFSIPLINWAIDSAMDLPAACTMWKILGLKDATLMDMLELLSDPGNAYQTLKDQGVICGSFATPFGHDEEGNLRTFPFASYSFDVRADCAEAMARGEVIKLGSRTVPLCTNMILGVSGASLGVGLGMDLNVGSNLITADWSTAGDARASPEGDTDGGTLEYRHSANEGDSALTVGPVYFDNWELTGTGGAFVDDGRIVLDDFTYYIDTIVVTLRATLMFGGILSPIPDIASFELFTFEFNASELTGGGFQGIPIPQHPGTEPVVLTVPVENYALEVAVAPGTTDPTQLDLLGALKVTPGVPGTFHVRVHNAGSRADDFSNFTAVLTNNPFADSEMNDLAAEGNFVFAVDANTDRDCAPPGGSCFGGGQLRGWPACYYDEAMRVPLFTPVTPCIDEDPLGPSGAPRETRDEDDDGWPDEDPPDIWLTAPAGSELAGQVIATVSAHTLSDGLVAIDVTPFRHPLTAPGLYGFRVAADSVMAGQKGMPAADASGLRRIDAWDVGYFRVESFYDPQVTTVPLESAPLKPGLGQEYEVEGTNGGNNDDAMSVTVTFLDFNDPAGCTLTTLGRLPEGADPDCPYRALPTVIDLEWADEESLVPSFPSTDPPGLLEPLGSESDALNVAVPRDWAGMDDTIYEYNVTVVSQQDPAMQPATNTRTVSHRVTATTESMTRYIGLEITELIATLEALNAAGVKTAGLLHIAAKPLKMQNDKALEKALAGDVDGACKTHTTGTRLAGAFLHALEGSGKGLEQSVYDDLHARGEAILADQTRAAAEAIQSAP